MRNKTFFDWIKNRNLALIGLDLKSGIIKNYDSKICNNTVGTKALE